MSLLQKSLDIIFSNFSFNLCSFSIGFLTAATLVCLVTQGYVSLKAVSASGGMKATWTWFSPYLVFITWIIVHFSDHGKNQHQTSLSINPASALLTFLNHKGKTELFYVRCQEKCNMSCTLPRKLSHERQVSLLRSASLRPTCCTAANIFLYHLSPRPQHCLLEITYFRKPLLKLLCFCFQLLCNSKFLNFLHLSKFIKLLRLIHSNFKGPMVSKFVSLYLNSSVGKNSFVISQHFKSWRLKRITQDYLDVRFILHS